MARMVRMARSSTFIPGPDKRFNYADDFVADVHVKKNTVKLLAFLCVIGALIYLAVPFTNIGANAAETTIPTPAPAIPSYFSRDGFLFPDSSTVRLTTSEIRELRDVAAANAETYRDLLRYAVNEIYARHGYRFESGLRFDAFYSQFEWYRALPKQSTVSWSEFNDVESYNLGLLLAEEEKNGYR